MKTLKYVFLLGMGALTVSSSPILASFALTFQTLNESKSTVADIRRYSQSGDIEHNFVVVPGIAAQKGAGYGSGIQVVLQAQGYHDFTEVLFYRAEDVDFGSTKEEKTLISQNATSNLYQVKPRKATVKAGQLPIANNTFAPEQSFNGTYNDIFRIYNTSTTFTISNCSSSTVFTHVDDDTYRYTCDISTRQ